MPQFCSPAVERADFELRSWFLSSSVSGRLQQFAIRSWSRSFVCHSETLQTTRIFDAASVLEVVIKSGDYVTFLTQTKGAFQPRMIGTHTYQSGGDASSESVARQRHSVSAANSYNLSPCQSGCSPSNLQSPHCRRLAHHCIKANASRAPCVTRWNSKRVCSANGRRWHWYRSHGAQRMSRVEQRTSAKAFADL